MCDGHAHKPNIQEAKAGGLPRTQERLNYIANSILAMLEQDSVLKKKINKYKLNQPLSIVFSVSIYEKQRCWLWAHTPPVTKTLSWQMQAIKYKIESLSPFFPILPSIKNVKFYKKLTLHPIQCDCEVQGHKIGSQQESMTPSFQ